jgi:secreted PhoX family phosphatase
MGAGALWMLSLGELAARRPFGPIGIPSPYGPVSPKRDETTGLELLSLPDGFRYLSYAWTGERLSDGLICPGAHDGMAVIAATPGTSEVVLVRNHEQNAGPTFGRDADLIYSKDAAGGTVNLTFDVAEGRWRRAWMSLAGTHTNCAGGVTPWGTWLTCEETPVRGHGFIFEVGVERGDRRPLEAMGRYAHEAVMVDPDTGIVYETEDALETSGFYRFVPHVRGDLRQGGELSMLRVKGRPNVDMGVGYPIGTKWDVEWVRIADPLATRRSTFAQGRLQGAARFQRLEGAWWGDRVGYFISTSGGAEQCGQVFEFDPRAETVTLIYESPSAAECDYPDNVTVSPRGGLLLCEDSGNTGSVHERLVGLTLQGQTFTFAQNNAVFHSAPNAAIAAQDYRGGEFAGCCYSPDGRWLFVNAQRPGITFAITGPWGTGPL